MSQVLYGGHLACSVNRQSLEYGRTRKLTRSVNWKASGVPVLPHYTEDILPVYSEVTCFRLATRPGTFSNPFDGVVVVVLMLVSSMNRQQHEG
jgi:hypothetical protein